MSPGISNRNTIEHLHRRLIAKALGELHFEEAWCFESQDDHYLLQVAEDKAYRFRGEQGIWGRIWVEAESIERRDNGNWEPASDAALFFAESAHLLGLNDLTCGPYIEEILQTLHADHTLFEARAGMSAETLVDLPEHRLQAFLDGHPKAIPSKGRIGWGSVEFQRYAPESAEPFRLVWLAVRKALCHTGLNPKTRFWDLPRQSMSETDYERLMVLLDEAGISESEYHLLPVHPWQWQSKIRVFFQSALSRGDLIFLGAMGDRYLPQISLRTLSNADRPFMADIKLPLTILNTSCYRGLPGAYIGISAELSRTLTSICERDTLLNARNTGVLEEPAGISCIHPTYEKIAGVPYRYKEMLGAVWRQSCAVKIGSDEKAVLTAVLLQCDNEDRPLVQVYMQRSGLSPRAWMRAYFEVVVVPLYHLLSVYGVGIVAHGQNTTLVLRNHIPRGLLIKDLQGDLRLVDEDFPELMCFSREIRNTLTKLPAQYIIHDLVTGHFITVLRFLSHLCARHGLLEEPEFYQLLAEVVQEYQNQHPQYRARYSLFDLFTPRIKRVCINRVRFSEGYGDNATRPLPILGSDLVNPLVGTHEEVMG